MDHKQTTLGEFFSFSDEELSQDKLSDMESVNGIASIKKALSEKAKAIKWPMAYSEIINKVGDLLKIDLSDIMVAAWNKYRILLKYRDKDKYPSDETFLVPLAEHTIKSEHHPFLEILVNEKQLGKVEFTINVALTFKGITLKIQDGKVKEIQTGTCKGKGTVKCEGFEILEKKLKPFTLPGSVHLGEGLPIEA